jgi:sulfur carrier protein
MRSGRRSKERCGIQQEDGQVEVFVNGEVRQLPEGMTVMQLLEKMALTDKRLAVEVNLEIVPRSLLLSHVLHAGDRIEIVQAIGGG